MTTQLAFPFDSQTADFSRANFIRHRGNEKAHDYLQKTTWLTPATFLFGDKFTGKSYLANLWAQQTQAFSVTPLWLQTKELLISTLFNKNHPAFVLDNLALFLVSKEMESNLFHLYNFCAQNDKKLLVTGRQSPARTDFALADLASRLRAATAFELQEPEECQKEVFLLKFFSDFQILPDMGIVKYIGIHGPRSLSALHGCVQKLHETSMQQKKRVSIALVKEVLGG